MEIKLVLCIILVVFLFGFTFGYFLNNFSNKNKKLKNKNIDTNQDSFANYNDEILEQKLLKNFSLKDYEDFLNIKEINFYEINGNGEKGKKVLTLDRLDNIRD